MFMGLLFISSLIIALWMAAYCQWPLKLWTVLLLGLLILFSVLPGTPEAVIVACWVVLTPVMLTLNIPRLRCRLISTWALKVFKKRQPKLSDTELAALRAGDVWWEKQLFSGDPDWTELFSFHKNQLADHERDFIDTKVKKLCAMLDDWEINHHLKDLPENVWNFIKREKFFGMIIPQSWGGLGFSAFAHSTVITMIASRSYAAAVNIMVPNSLGPAEFILHYGTDRQKKEYLPRLASGKDIPCFALTGPSAGSDAASITDTGVVCEDEYNGQRMIGLRLNWNKRYITLAPKATLMGLAVRVSDPDHFLGKTVDCGISFVLVPTGLPGVSIGSRHIPLDCAFINGPTRGENVFIPLDNVIGGPEKIGCGWEMMMASLAVGRGISLPAVSSGTLKHCYALTSAYARVREQFKVPIGSFEGVQEALSRIGGYTYMTEAARLFTVSAIDSGIKPSIASAISKYHLTELSRKGVNDAMDIHGGRGIIMGEHNYLAHYYLSAPINITVEGANIMTRNLIIFGQGALRCHPFAADEINAAADDDPRSQIARFDHLIFEHLGYFSRLCARAWFYSLTGGRLIAVPKDMTARFLRQLTRMSTALALISDISMMVLGSELKRTENLSSRLGDVLSHLYLASSVIKYFHDNYRDESDRPYVIWCLKTCLFNIQEAMFGFMENFPNKFIGQWMRWAIFLWGRPYKPPTDEESQAIAISMQEDSKFRWRLLRHCYRSDKNDDPANQMQRAFELILLTERSHQKLQTAKRNGKIDRNMSFEDELDAAFQIGVLDQHEIKQLKARRDCQEVVIQVDDY